MQGGHGGPPLHHVFGRLSKILLSLLPVSSSSRLTISGIPMKRTSLGVISVVVTILFLIFSSSLCGSQFSLCVIYRHISSLSNGSSLCFFSSICHSSTSSISEKIAGNRLKLSSVPLILEKCISLMSES